MGGLAERMVDQAVAALVGSDPGLATKVIGDDLMLDEAQREIDEKALLFIARRQPVAGDLREIIGTIRICNGEWCEMEFANTRGWISQSLVWGAYPGETIAD